MKLFIGKLLLVQVSDCGPLLKS